MWRIALLGVSACAEPALERPRARVEPMELAWTYPSGEAQLRIGNDGEVPLGVARVELIGEDAGAFEVTDTLEPATGLAGAVRPGEEAVFTVTFTAPHQGGHGAALRIVYGEGDLSLPVHERPTVDRRRALSIVFLTADLPGKAPPSPRIRVAGVRAEPTATAPGEVLQLEARLVPREMLPLHATWSMATPHPGAWLDVLDDEKATFQHDGYDPPTVPLPFLWTAVAPHGRALVAGVDGVGAELEWLDEPIR